MDRKLVYKTVSNVKLQVTSSLLRILLMRTTVFKIWIKVAAAPPPPPPISNINNSYLLQTLIQPFFWGLVITETLPISIFLAVSSVNKVSYKLYRRGCPKLQSTMLFGIKLSSAVCISKVETLLAVLWVWLK